ncbi:hypothetical protein [Microbulbifer discodermiae]|uniref:hypothetical protein n=1 Tax=Microbulbifer sp. 2201CG32-9 TaxID=3232309 RepID=UPI00345C07AE
MPVSAERSVQQYAPLTINFVLETAHEEQAFRDFLGALNMQMIEAVLQAHNSDTATPERVSAVAAQFQEMITAMAPLGSPTES